MAKRSSVYFEQSSGSFVGLDEAKMRHLKETYEDVNIEAELDKMKWWLMSNPSRAGTMSFIANWLSKAPRHPKEVLHLSPVLPLLEEHYLRELWKGREQLLNMNQRS